MAHYDCCVVGAGPSGLTAAYQMLQRGWRVAVIERDSRIGGLAKSHDYDGQIFDTGPKRFHTEDPVVMAFISEVMGSDLLQIGRSTQVHFQDRYFRWPLRSGDIWKLPPSLALRCLADLLGQRRIENPHSFRQFICSKYGRTLYEQFFAPYTAKFLRWDPEDIHADWAATGVNRSVVDKRIQASTLLDLVRSVLLPKEVDTEFLYPRAGGFGGFYERLVDLCCTHSEFDLGVSETIDALENQGSRLAARTSKERSLTCDHIVWTGNLNDLCRLIGRPAAEKGPKFRVRYLNTIFYNLICREAGVGPNRAQWIYVSRGDSLVSRVTCMREFAPYTCRDGYYNMICEVTDSQSEPIYFHDVKAHVRSILRELVDMGFLRDTRFVEDVRIDPVRDTYPVYHSSYLRDFGAAVREVRAFSRRIHLAGRSGAFWYNNSDHSIRQAIELVRRLHGERGSNFDYRGYFGRCSASSPAGGRP